MDKHFYMTIETGSRVLRQTNLLGDAAVVGAEVWRESRAPNASTRTALGDTAHFSVGRLDAADAVAARRAC